MLQNIALGGMMIALPIYFQMVFEYNAMQTGLSIAPISLSIFFIAMLAGRRAGKRRPSRIIQAGLRHPVRRRPAADPADPAGQLRLGIHYPADHHRQRPGHAGLAAQQLHAYRLSPKSGSAKPPGVNSAGGSFGLSFGLAFAGAIMLASLAFAFNYMAQSSLVLTPVQQDQVAVALEEDAQIMSDTLLAEQLAGQPPDVQAEILRINTQARYIGLQVALLVPLHRQPDRAGQFLPHGQDARP